MKRIKLEKVTVVFESLGDTRAATIIEGDQKKVIQKHNWIAVRKELERYLTINNLASESEMEKLEEGYSFA